MKHAVIETGGKQYLVAEGSVLTIEKLPKATKGDSVTFDKVLLVDDGKEATLGMPYVKGAKVTGKVEDEGRGKKILVVKYKAKSRYYKKRGHRQPYAKVTITAL